MRCTLQQTKRFVLPRALGSGLIVVCLLNVNACGGGSSGTGEDDTVGQMIDRFCQPVGSFDMSQVGLETTAQLTADDGTFTLTPTGASSVQVSDGSRGREVDVSRPVCVLIVYDGGAVVSVNAYPRESLVECSIDGVRESGGRQQLPLCLEGQG